MELFDSHAHYNDERLRDHRDDLIFDMYNDEITNIVCAGYSLEASREAVDIANKYPHVFATCGISPNDIEDYSDENLQKIENLAKYDKVVAIGEIWLDYYWNKENKDIQKHAFIQQIKIANELDLPIVIHTREAVQDTLEILKTHKTRGVFHCCPLNIELIKEGLKLGFYISFAGPITFKNSKNANQVIEYVPLEKMLIETDSPYLSPEPLRGTRNDSRNVKYIAQKIADVKNIPLEEVARITYENAKKVFNIE